MTRGAGKSGGNGKDGRVGWENEMRRAKDLDGRTGGGGHAWWRAWGMVWLAGMAWVAGMAWGGPVGGGRGLVDDYVVEWHGMEQGLPGGGTTSMAQDSAGYLWFATFQGLARFDGLEFKTYEPDNTPALPSAGVVSAYRDRQGRVWFSTYGGMASLHEGQWRRHGKEDGWTASYARGFAEHPDGTMYVVRFDGQVLRRGTNGPFIEMPATPAPELGGIPHCDPEGRLWVAKPSFVGFWDGARWVAVLEDFLKGHPGDDSAAGPARDGRLWFVKGSSLVKVGVGGVVQHVRLDRAMESPWALHEDSVGNVWVPSWRRGLYHLDLSASGGAAVDGGGAAVVARVTHLDRWGGREFRSVRFVSEDDEGNVWVGTASDGLARLRPKLVWVAGELEGLGPDNFRSASVDRDGRLWATSHERGVYWCDVPGAGAPFQRLNDPMLAVGEAVLADRWGHVWATGMGPGQPVFRLDGGVARVVYQDGDEQGSRGALFEDEQGRVWVAGQRDLLCHEQGRWARHGVPAVFGFGQEKGGPMRVCCPAGLLELRDGAFVPVEDKDGKPVTGVGCMAPASDGGMWLGMQGSGLAWISPEGRVGRVGEAEGLPMRSPTSVFKDEHGWLWLGGARGIARVSEREARRVAQGLGGRIHARMLDSGEGLPVNGHVVFARQPKVAATRDGRVWFPTTRGLAWVWPNRIPKNPRGPQLVPTVMRHVDADGELREVPWSEGVEIRLPAGSRAVRVAFSALNYAAPDQVLVRTRLERDGELLVEHHGPERAASYELLPPGRYSVYVTAANEDGVPASTAIRARFVIDPYLWQTTWFRLGLGLAGVGLVLGAAGYWVRHVRLAAKLALAERDRVAALESAEKAEALRQSEVRREKAEAEAEWRRQREAVLRDVHDGVGGLVANLQMTTSLALHAPDAAGQRAQIQHLDAMAHEALLEVRSLMDALEVQVADVECLAGEFERYGNLVLGPHGIRLRVSAEAKGGCSRACGPLFLGLFRIVKEALANVVKHSGATSVEVRVVASHEGLSLAIGDDGRGLPDGGRTGRGLLSMRRRAEELGGKMTLDSGGGLRLHFVVPWPGHDAARAHKAGPGNDVLPSVSSA